MILSAFSAVSIFQILFFCVLRIFCVLRRHFPRFTHFPPRFSAWESIKEWLAVAIFTLPRATMDSEVQLTKKEKLILSKKRAKERKKQLTRERVRRHREKKKHQLQRDSTISGFQNRVSFKRALDNVKNSLPETPEKKANIIRVLSESPRTKELLSTQSQAKDDTTAILEDIKDAVSSIKHKRSDDARTAMQVGISMLCGKNAETSTSKKNISEKLGINRRRIAQSIQHRSHTSIGLTPWTALKRKTRNDATPEEVRRLAYEFWQSPGISRPTGNKRDIAKERIGPKEYVEHEKHILEKTQTEVFHDFKQKYPEIKIGQRYFASCKPFFVIPARIKDRNSCCCRMHVETNMMFKSAMEYRRRHATENVKVYSHLSELVSDTLCPLSDSASYHKKACIERTCTSCGVKKLELLREEEKGSNSDNQVQWQRFEYVDIADKRKLKIVTKQTSVSEMFAYFLKLLEEYPAHQFWASWQNRQMQNLLQNLPLNHVCAVHDYSENYSCQHQDQIQSLYFGQTQVSIHVTVLHRHAVPIDNEPESSVITEHLFVISPDLTHDSHAVHRNRQLIVDYLKEIGCTVEMLHEWTDGCSAQYKSRHCMGDVSKSYQDFGFDTIRNYFETSHAKGPQDGAGANLKYKCDMAVIKRQACIQDAKDLYDFAQKEFQNPAPSRYQSDNVKLKRRVYFYVDSVDRNRPYRLFKEVEGNRKIHSITSQRDSGNLKTRSISCYCSSCLKQQYNTCENKDYVSQWSLQKMEPEKSYGDERITRARFEEQTIQIADLTCKGCTVAIASADQGEDYYLFKLSEDGPFILDSLLKDDWGSEYPSGAKVIKGNFLVKSGSCDHSSQAYRLIEDRIAVVYAATVRFICQDLEMSVNGDYVIDQKQHEEILGSLDGF